jgi:hypothetical protein
MATTISELPTVDALIGALDEAASTGSVKRVIVIMLGDDMKASVGIAGMLPPEAVTLLLATAEAIAGELAPGSEPHPKDREP